jgi:hypothetical protein
LHFKRNIINRLQIASMSVLTLILLAGSSFLDENVSFIE